MPVEAAVGVGVAAPLAAAVATLAVVAATALAGTAPVARLRWAGCRSAHCRHKQQPQRLLQRN